MIVGQKEMVLQRDAIAQNQHVRAGTKHYSCGALPQLLSMIASYIESYED